MSKSTNNWKKVVAFIKTCSADGLEAVMGGILTRVGSFTPEQQDQFNAIVDKDNVAKSAAKLTAAQATGSLDTYNNDIAPVIAAASFADVKRYIHAVDTRLKSLPVDQRQEVMSAPGAQGQGLPQDPLAALLGGIALPDDGSYMGDDGDDSYDDAELDF